ncbi:MAG: hypothetical protein AAFR62_21925, partial [Cyanobacteria bacterium J06629_2]
MKITGKTKVLGIIGDPVEHSLSPVMHNAAIANLGVDYIYVPFPVQSDNLSTALTGFGAVNVQGFSIKGTGGRISEVAALGNCE